MEEPSSGEWNVACINCIKRWIVMRKQKLLNELVRMCDGFVSQIEDDDD